MTPFQEKIKIEQAKIWEIIPKSFWNELVRRTNFYLSGSCLYNSLYLGEAYRNYDIDFFVPNITTEELWEMFGCGSRKHLTEYKLAKVDGTIFISPRALNIRKDGITYQLIPIEGSIVDYVLGFDFAHTMWYSNYYGECMATDAALWALETKTLSYNPNREIGKSFIPRYEKFISRGLVPDDRTKLKYKEAKNAEYGVVKFQMLT